MTIVFSTSDEFKVDLFLKMVDYSKNNKFSFNEIKDICLFTFESRKNPPQYDSDGKLIKDILTETAEFQAMNIFNLLKYEHN